MSPQPLRIRVLRALELAPMTVRDLARCLCASQAAVWRQAETISQSGEITRARTPARRKGRAPHVYRIAS